MLVGSFSLFVVRIHYSRNPSPAFRADSLFTAADVPRAVALPRRLAWGGANSTKGFFRASVFDPPEDRYV